MNPATMATIVNYTCKSFIKLTPGIIVGAIFQHDFTRMRSVLKGFLCQNNAMLTIVLYILADVSPYC